MRTPSPRAHRAHSPAPPAFALIALLAGALAACQSGATERPTGPGDVPVTPTPIAGATAEMVRFANGAGHEVHAALYLPDGTDLPPAVIVLHGSGGLFRNPEPEDLEAGRICSQDLERQFREWAELLTGAGYAAIFPASFFSRGFCDYHDDAPPDFDAEARLVARVLDLHATADYLRGEARVAGAPFGLVGFSNGGSTVILGLHEALGDIAGLESLAGHDLGVANAVAYYPGCGLQALVTLSDDPGDLADFYYPVAPLLVQHAELDPLREHCPTRESQVSQVATARNTPSPWEMLVHLGADHGFDSTPDNAAETTAQGDGRTRTLSRLDAALR